MGVGRLRILFASVHSYIDPSSGAAISARHLLELLAGRGHDCRTLTTGVLDYHRETDLGSVLAGCGAPARHALAPLDGGVAARVIGLELEGVRVIVLPTASSRIACSPDRAEAAAFLELARQALDRFRPHVLLTFGGHPAILELMAGARRRGVPPVFFLRNLAYRDRRTFADAAAVLVPSEFCRRHYAGRLGLACTALPSPIRRDRVVATAPSPRYLTFVNPLPAKGAAVFARIAAELDRRRPDIPLLVVEGRGHADDLSRLVPGLCGLANLYRMGSTPDPRDFYRVSRVVLMPSLVRETFGRVAAEAMANGLPVLASDRGALPEVLGAAGFIFPLPERLGGGDVVPTADEVAPWVATVERLWDNPALEAEQRARARAESRRWDEGRLAAAYESVFARLAAGPGVP